MSSQIQNFYPVFAPNQVLTDTQLNHMRTYLDEQNRSTRTRLIGAGIICGLHAHHSYEENALGERSHTLSISAGYGLSSDGYLIDYAGASFKQYRKYQGIDADEDKTWDYELWHFANEKAKNYPDHAILELIPQGDTEGVNKADYQDDEIKDLGEQDFNCKIMVLFLECEAVDLKSCTITDCSNKGEQIEFKVRALLVHEDDLEVVLPPAIYLTETEDLRPLKELQIFVPRFHTEIDDTDNPSTIQENCKLQSIDQTADIRYAYGKISKDVCGDFKTKLDSIYKDNDKRGNFLDLPDISSYLDRLTEIIKDKQDNQDFTQYHFAFVRDLACAFNEFLEAYCALVKDCNPVSGFPRHLMLRRLIEDTPDSQGGYYRNSFTPSPVKNVMHESWDITHKMFMRLLSMIEDFRDDLTLNYTNLVSLSGGTRITPSHDALHPLGKQALPFYYRVNVPGSNGSIVDARILDYWQSAPACFLDPINSYYYQQQEYSNPGDFPEYSTYPLQYDLQKHSFYRIEGHLGRKCTDVLRDLNTFCKFHNLDFDLITLSLGGVSASTDYIPFNEFVNDHFGMEYMGGVKPGGTFILVCAPSGTTEGGDIIVADFALNGKISTYLKQDPLDEEELGYHDEGISAAPVTASIQTAPSQLSSRPSGRSLIPEEEEGTQMNLNSRRQSRIQSIYAFNEGGSYSKNRTFASAQNFISKAKIPADSLDSDFKDVLGKLKSVYKRTKGQKQQDYQGMMKLVMQSYMDHLVELTPSALPTAAKDTLTEEITDLKTEFGISAADLKKSWKASEVKKLSKAKVIDQINKLIK